MMLGLRTSSTLFGAMVGSFLELLVIGSPTPVMPKEYCLKGETELTGFADPQVLVIRTPGSR